MDIGEVAVTNRNPRSNSYYAVCYDTQPFCDEARAARRNALRFISVRGQWGRKANPKRFATVDAAEAYISDNQTRWARQGVAPYISRVTNITSGYSWWMPLGTNHWNAGFMR